MTLFIDLWEPIAQTKGNCMINAPGGGVEVDCAP